jgi:hypothetical protein
MLKYLLVLIFITNHYIQTASVGPFWPQTQIAYSISDNFDFKSIIKIEQTLLTIQNLLQVDLKHKCIEFQPRDNQTDFIVFTNDGECTSDIGYSNGINKISLTKDCLDTNSIIHQVMHILGFDHENNRLDRNEHIDINFENYLETNNSNNKSNRFKINSLLDAESLNHSPYDYHSILHLNSNSFQKDKSIPLIKSKFNSFNNLMLINSEDRSTTNLMSPIDIIEIQNNYGCKSIKMPDILYEHTVEDSKLRTDLEKRFKLEADFLRRDKQLMNLYLNKTFETCGMNHYWPFDYPLVESQHKHYQLYCLQKKKTTEKCRFSLECVNDAVCVRFAFKTNGLCVKPGSVGRDINDAMFKLGKKFKDIFG